MPPSDHTPVPQGRASRTARAGRLVAAGALLAAGASAYLLWHRSGPAADYAPLDPRLTFETPYRNVRPDVDYVGDAACAGCHPDVDRSYHQHPMGRSAAFPVPGGEPGRFAAYGHATFRIDPAGNSAVHTEVLAGPDGQSIATAAEVVAVIGSGTRGKSYLCARDGSLWQSGASWFAEKPGWDVSPSFGPGGHARRPVLPECVFCHVNRVEPIPGTANRYKEPFFGDQIAIGCERCHGPGALHVAERAAGPPPAGQADTSVVNPRRLPPDLREDVCRQCHFQGEYRLVRRGREPFDYRPGMPLELFLSVYVKHPDLTDYHKSVGQVEQVAVSKCAAGSGGRFGCTSCHDPHDRPAPAARANYYRARCLACHQEHGCSLPAADRQPSGDACTSCHMPRSASSSIAHTAITDHRVLRRPAPGLGPKGVVPPGDLPLTPFAQPARWPDDDERARDLAIALAVQPQLAPAVAEPVVARLLAFTARHPGDVDAWEALATVRLKHGNGADALQAAEAAVKARPDRERALGLAATAALRADRPDLARKYAARAVVANPGDPEHRLRLAQALIAEEDYAGATAELQTLLKATQNHPQARAALAVCLFKQGRTREALAELGLAAAIDPHGAAGLRTWFAARTR